VLDRHTIIHTNSSVLYAYGADMPRLVYTNNISERAHDAIAMADLARHGPIGGPSSGSRSSTRGTGTTTECFGETVKEVATKTRQWPRGC
jgi:hypothetical protein